MSDSDKDYNVKIDINNEQTDSVDDLDPGRKRAQTSVDLIDLKKSSIAKKKSKFVCDGEKDDELIEGSGSIGLYDSNYYMTENNKINKRELKMRLFKGRNKGGESNTSLNKSIIENCLDTIEDDFINEKRSELKEDFIKFKRMRKCKSWDCLFAFKSKNTSVHKKLKSLMDKVKNTEFHLVADVTVCMEPNIKFRDHMEDIINIESYNCNNEYQRIYVLCDGHNGDHAAKEIAETLPKLFSSQIEESQSMDTGKYDIEQALEMSFTIMDEKLRELGEEKIETSGSTANLVFICLEKPEKIVYSANVGDSRTILIRKECALRLSYDHKASDKEEQKRVKKEGGLIIKNRFYGTLAITRALADFEMKDGVDGLSYIPYISKTEVNPTDRYIIMCSDGLTDVVTDELFFKLVNEYESRKDLQVTLAEYLVKYAVNHNSRDNISCVAIKL